MSPHGVHWPEPGSDEQLAYFEARAKGGAVLLVLLAAQFTK